MENVQHEPAHEARRLPAAAPQAGCAADELICDLVRQVADLRAELASLRAELGREVRTERLVVVHPDDGRELISTNRLAHAVQLHIGWAGDDGPAVSIVAGDEQTDEGEASIAMLGGGDVVASLELAGGGVDWYLATASRA